MQNTQGFSLSHRHLEFNSMMRKKQISSKQLKASLYGMLYLDDYYHLEGVVSMLRNLQLGIAFQSIGATLSEEQKNMVMDYLKLLNDLATEFEWQVYNGVRLYRPL